MHLISFKLHSDDTNGDITIIRNQGFLAGRIILFLSKGPVGLAPGRGPAGPKGPNGDKGAFCDRSETSMEAIIKVNLA